MSHHTFFLPSETPIEKTDPQAAVFGIIADHRAGASRSPAIFDRVMRCRGGITCRYSVTRQSAPLIILNITFEGAW